MIDVYLPIVKKMIPIYAKILATQYNLSLMTIVIALAHNYKEIYL